MRRQDCERVRERTEEGIGLRVLREVDDRRAGLLGEGAGHFSAERAGERADAEACEDGSGPSRDGFLGDRVEIGFQPALDGCLGGVRIAQIERAATDDEAAPPLESVGGQRIRHEIPLFEIVLAQPHRGAERLVFGCGRALLGRTQT